MKSLQQVLRDFFNIECVTVGGDTHSLSANPFGINYTMPFTIQCVITSGSDGGSIDCTRVPSDIP